MRGGNQLPGSRSHLHRIFGKDKKAVYAWPARSKAFIDGAVQQGPRHCAALATLQGICAATETHAQVANNGQTCSNGTSWKNLRHIVVEVRVAQESIPWPITLRSLAEAHKHIRMSKRF